MKQNCIVPNIVRSWLEHNRLCPNTVYGEGNDFFCIFANSAITIKLGNDHNKIQSVRFSPGIFQY